MYTCIQAEYKRNTSEYKRDTRHNELVTHEIRILCILLNEPSHGADPAQGRKFIVWVPTDFCRRILFLSFNAILFIPQNNESYNCHHHSINFYTVYVLMLVQYVYNQSCIRIVLCIRCIRIVLYIRWHSTSTTTAVTKTTAVYQQLLSVRVL